PGCTVDRHDRASTAAARRSAAGSHRQTATRYQAGAAAGHSAARWTAGCQAAWPGRARPSRLSPLAVLSTENGAASLRSGDERLDGKGCPEEVLGVETCADEL